MRDESDPRSPTEFDLAASRVVASLERRSREAMSTADYRIVLKTLTTFARGFGLSETDAQEIAAEVLEETFERGADATKDAIRKPAGFLFWLTRNRVFDRHRRARLRADAERTAGPRYYSHHDDELAALLERETTAAQLDDALRAAAAADDLVVVHVVAAWLELAALHGEAPTSRQVAPEAGVSHTTINHALRRLRQYFPPEQARSSYPYGGG